MVHRYSRVAGLSFTLLTADRYVLEHLENTTNSVKQALVVFLCLECGVSHHAQAYERATPRATCGLDKHGHTPEVEWKHVDWLLLGL